MRIASKLDILIWFSTRFKLEYVIKIQQILLKGKQFVLGDSSQITTSSNIHVANKKDEKY